MSRVLHLIAHNIRSAQNVGSMVRTCDSLGVAKLWITGYSPTPEQVGVAKTALGAQKVVDWEQSRDVMPVLSQLRKKGFRIVGLEIDSRAVDLSVYQPSKKVALILGSEVEGITPSLRAECDDLVFITQHGIKESMNVSVATGIAAWTILRVS